MIELLALHLDKRESLKKKRLAAALLDGDLRVCNPVRKNLFLFLLFSIVLTQ